MSDRRRRFDRIAVSAYDAVRHHAARGLVKRIRRGVRRRDWGDLDRSRPFSGSYGADRGTPVDRVFIESFLAENDACIRGRVLEVKNSMYTRRFGGRSVTAAEVLDLSADNRRATIVADLGTPGSLPVSAFDCFLLIQTLQCVHDPVQGLRNAFESLAPAGTLLITVPVAAKVESAYDDFWRWTPIGFRELLQRSLPGVDVTMRAYGSFHTLIAYLYGMAAEELDPAELHRTDTDHPVTITARLTKPETGIPVGDHV